MLYPVLFFSPRIKRRKISSALRLIRKTIYGRYRATSEPFMIYWALPLFRIFIDFKESGKQEAALFPKTYSSLLTLPQLPAKYCGGVDLVWVTPDEI